MNLYLLSIVISLDEEYIIMHSWSLMNGIGVGGQNRIEVGCSADTQPLSICILERSVI